MVEKSTRKIRSETVFSRLARHGISRLAAMVRGGHFFWLFIRDYRSRAVTAAAPAGLYYVLLASLSRHPARTTEIMPVGGGDG